jgi:flagellar hook-associated protein 2
MAIPTFNVGGLLSGLDTNSIVSQLMQLERQPVFQLQRRQSDYETKNRTWDSINTKLTAVQDKLDALKLPSDWQTFASATSSNTDALTVTSSGSATFGDASFTVDRLATTHQMASSGTFTSTSDTVGAGDFTITVGGEDHTISTTATTTVSQLINEVKNLDAGVSASLLFTGSGTAKLVLRADESGGDAAFTTSTDISSLGSFSIVEQGVDAQLTVGSGVGALTVERASNVIDDFLDGATITLKATTTQPVDISVSRDTEAASEAIKQLVDSLNAAISTLATATKAGGEDSTGGPLAMDATARNLGLRLRSVLSSVVSDLDSDYRTASSVGVSLTREGSYTLDTAKLTEALENDFDAVAALFQRTTAVSDSRVSVTRVGDAAADGTHAVQITQAATTASVTGSSLPLTLGGESFTITSGSDVASITISALASIDDAVTAITDALDAAGISTISVQRVGDSIALTESRYGNAGEFTVSGNTLGLAGTHTGLDVEGTIGGLAATGSGRSLTGSGDLSSVILDITATAAQVSAAGGSLGLGTITINSGAAVVVDDYLETLTETGGVVDRARDRWDAQIELLKDRIEQFEDRLESREVALRRQYSALESTLARLNSASASLFAALPQQGF